MRALSNPRRKRLKKIEFDKHPLEIEMLYTMSWSGKKRCSVRAIYGATQVSVMGKSLAATEKRVCELLGVTPTQWKRARERFKKARALCRKRASVRRRPVKRVYRFAGRPKKRALSSGGARVQVSVYAEDKRLGKKRLAEVLDALGGAAPEKKTPVGGLLIAARRQLRRCYG